MIDISKYCIVIPAYNAENDLLLLIEKIQKIYQDIFIFIIDDGSTNKTIYQIEETKQIKIYSHLKNKGKGSAILTGIKKALKQNFKYALFLDSDLQHDPIKIPDFIKLQHESCADMVLGFRKFELNKMPFMRILSNTITSMVISLRCGKKVRDSQCGYRLINLEKIDINQYIYSGFQFESEFLIRALDNNIKFKEIEISTIYSSEKSSINSVFDTLKFIKLFFHSFFWK